MESLLRPGIRAGPGKGSLIERCQGGVSLSVSG